MISFEITQKVNPREPDAPRKYYATSKSKGKLNARQLAELISRETMLGSVETLAVLEALMSAVPRLLAQGQIVDLAEFGTFWVSLRSNGAESPEAFNAAMIKGAKINFRPGKEFNKHLAALKYHRAPSNKK